MDERKSLVKISIEDTGIGIKQEDIGKLFQMFSMLSDNLKQNKTGTGMGLYISKNLSQYLAKAGDSGL